MLLVRSHALRAYDHHGVLALVGGDGGLRELSEDSADLARAVLAYLDAPRTLDEIAEHLGELAGQPVKIEGAVEEAIQLLRDTGAIVEHNPAIKPPATPERRRRLVLALTGGVASAVAPALVPMLQSRGFEVRVAATKSSLRFVSVLALEALTHAPVRASIWPTDPRAPVPHLELAEWAEIVVVFPASATSISRIATGNCSTVVSALAISARVPVVLVPSMNERMASAPSVMRNLGALRDDGFFVVHAGAGIEVADAPSDRPPRRGTAPPLGAIADIVEAIASRHVARPSAKERSWDAAYEAPIESLPWFATSTDPDVAAIFDAMKPNGKRLLDVGTGPGTVAIDAARRGFSVVATDVSPRALEAAAARAGALPIAWVLDDAAASTVRGTFDVIHDRGCLHTLPRPRHDAYAKWLAERAAPGALFVLKTMAPAEAEEVGLHAFSPEEIRSLFAKSFDVVNMEASSFPGPNGGRKALLSVLRRRAS